MRDDTSSVLGFILVLDEEAEDESIRVVARSSKTLPSGRAFITS